VAEKLTPEDLRLHWEESAVQLQRVVRLGRAWSTFRGKRLGVLKSDLFDDGPSTEAPGTLVGTHVATGQGTLALVEVRPESRTPMSAEDWLRGLRPLDGERLGSD
jgi:methionyl-tRNA formyltransferase